MLWYLLLTHIYLDTAVLYCIGECLRVFCTSFR